MGAVKRRMILGVSLSHQLAPAQRRTIGVWLLGCAGMVYGAVALGGITRHNLKLHQIVSGLFICLINPKLESVG